MQRTGLCLFLSSGLVTITAGVGCRAGWPTYGACAKFCALVDFKWRIFVIVTKQDNLLDILSFFFSYKSLVNYHLSSETRCSLCTGSNNETPEERALLCDNIWSETLVHVIDHLIHLNVKLQRKEKLFPNLINHINAFKMKLKLFISQLENEDTSQFPYLKEQGEGAVDNGNWENALKRSSYCKTFLIFLKKKTEFWHLYTHSYLVNNRIWKCQ